MTWSANGNRFSNGGGTVTQSYLDVDSTAQGSSGGSATGLTTSEMQGSSAETNMSGFDFGGTWTTVEGDYPELQD